MSITVAQLVAEIGAEISGLEKGTAQAKVLLQSVVTATKAAGDSAQKEFAESWVKADRSVTGVVSSITRSIGNVSASLHSLSAQTAQAGIAFSGAFSLPIAGLIKTGLMFDDLRKKSGIAFTSLLHNADQAKKMVADIEQLAANTPFQPGPLIQYTQQLAAMGEETKNLIPDLKAVTDAVTQMGKGEDAVGRVTYAIGEMIALGKIGERQLRMFSIDAGVNAHKLLSDWLGKSEEETTHMIEHGGLTGQTAKDAIQVLIKGLEKNAPDAAVKGMDTISGAMSNLKQFATQTLGDLFTPMYKNVVDTMNSTQGALGNFRKMIQDLGKTDPKVLVSLGNAMMAIAVAGPAMLAVSGAIKAVAILSSPIGLLAAAFGSVAYYMLQNKDEASKLMSDFADYKPLLIDIGKQVGILAESVGKDLLVVLKDLIPVLGEVLRVVDGFLQLLNGLPAPIRTAVIDIGLLALAFRGLQSVGAVGIVQTAIAIGSRLIPSIIAAGAAWTEMTALFGTGATVMAAVTAIGTTIKVAVLGAWTSVGTYITGTLAPAILALSASVLATTGVVLGLIVAAKGLWDIKQGEIAASDAQMQAMATSHPTIERLMPKYDELQHQLQFATKPEDKAQIKAQMDSLMAEMQRSLADFHAKAGSKIGQDIVSSISMGIKTPAGQASCAYFASQVLKDAGVAIKYTGGPRDLQSQLVAAGAKPHPAGEALAGDLLIFHGAAYGKVKDDKGWGYHAAIAMGAGRYAQSSGGVNSYQHMTASDMQHGLAYTVPDSMKKGAGLPPPPKDTTAADAAKELLDKYNDLVSKRKESIALFGKEGEAAKMRYDLEHGELAALSPQQKSYLMSLASQQDHLVSAKEAAENWKKVLEETADSAKDLRQTLSLGANATATQSMAWEFAHKDLDGLTAAQVKQIKAQQDNVVQMSRQKEAMEALNGLRQDAAMLALDEHKRNVVEAVGGLSQYNQLTPGEQAKAGSLYDANTRIRNNEEYASTIATLRSETMLLGNETEKAAISAAGGAEKWAQYSSSQRDVLRTQVSINSAMEALHGMFEEYTVRLADSMNPMRTEAENADVAIKKVTASLTAAGRSSSEIATLTSQIHDLAVQMDAAASAKLWKDMQSGFNDSIGTLNQRIAGTTTPQVEAQQKWVDANKQNIESIAKIQGPMAAVAFSAAGLAQSAEEFRLNIEATNVEKVRTMLGEADKTLLELNTADPFQKWLVSLEEIDKATGEIKLPAGFNQDDLHQAYNKQQQAKGIEEYQTVLKDVMLQAAKMSAESPFEVWLLQFEQLDELTGQFKLPDALDPQKMKQAFDMQSTMSMLEQFATGVSDLFGNLMTDIKDHGFKNLFQEIFTGFDNMLFKMATSYLQSQLLQLLNSGLSSAFGVQNLLGGMQGFGGTPGITGQGGGGAGGFGGLLSGGIMSGLGSLLGGGGGAPIAGLLTSTGSDVGDALLGTSIPSFGSWMANGGRASRGKSYVVGDGGEPELFTPDTAGTVTPMSKLGGSNHTHYHFSYNIQTNDPEQFRGVQARTIADAKQVADQHQRRNR